MVKTRFAPSPTGFIHIGHIRTALYSYALAKKHEGKFVLRIEDTDKTREIEGGIENIVKGLRIFGLKYDEGPEVGGPNGPYIQSERLDIYKEKAEKLVEEKKAYYCFCSKERLEKVRNEQQKGGKQPMYDKKCRNLDLEDAKKRVRAGEKYVIRLKIPENRRIEVEDEIHGKISWKSSDVDDQVLIKSDGFPTYHLAVVVDDVLMGITHITRGLEWLPSVPKHILLFEALEYKVPVMAHLPLILDPEGGKLSKRKGTVSVEDFLKQGYLPEALLNFLMLLGWSPKDDRETFSLKEFVRVFSLDELNKASPVFNRKKLLWFNGEYIRKYSKKDFETIVKKWLEEYGTDEKVKEFILQDKTLVSKLELIQERISVLSDVEESLKFFYESLPVPDLSTIKGVKRYGADVLKNCIKKYSELVNKYGDNSTDWQHEDWEKDIRNLADEFELKHGDVFMLIRLYVCGGPVSPPLFECMQLLGKEEIINRLDR